MLRRALKQQLFALGLRLIMQWNRMKRWKRWTTKTFKRSLRELKITSKENSDERQLRVWWQRWEISQDKANSTATRASINLSLGVTNSRNGTNLIDHLQSHKECSSHSIRFKMCRRCQQHWRTTVEQHWLQSAFQLIIVWLEVQEIEPHGIGLNSKEQVTLIHWS